MARIKYGPIIADISGSVGSATFQKSLYGNTLRNRPRNTRAGTAAQFTARNYMMQCQYAWRTMSEALRKQWNQFVAFSGQSINRDRGILTTGHSLFLKWNYARLQAGESIVTAIVYKNAPAWPTISSIYNDSDIVRIYFSTDLDAISIYPTVFLSPGRPESRSFLKAGLRFMYITDLTEDEAEIYDSYLDCFGTPIVVGSFVHCKFQFWSTESPIISAISTIIFEVQTM